MFDRSGDAFLSISLRNWEAEGLKQVENIFFEYFCYCGELANKKPDEHFFVKLALNMSPQTLKESTQDASNINQTRRQKPGCRYAWHVDPSWDDFGCISGANLGHKSGTRWHRRPKKILRQCQRNGATKWGPSWDASWIQVGFKIWTEGVSRRCYPPKIKDEPQVILSHGVGRVS